jgi:peroxiredoxin Q/BCP
VAERERLEPVMSTPISAPAEGARAPAFSLKSHTGQTVKLADFKGRTVVIYFYPKDNTPGCTVEAKEFQQNIAAFRRFGVEVIGISPDSVQSHCKFGRKFGLDFTLLSDEGHKVAEKYGLWVKKSMYGKKYWGVQRATFLVDPDGKIVKVWPKVKPQGHATEVLAELESL